MVAYRILVRMVSMTFGHDCQQVESAHFVWQLGEIAAAVNNAINAPAGSSQDQYAQSAINGLAILRFWASMIKGKNYKLISSLVQPLWDFYGTVAPVVLVYASVYPNRVTPGNSYDLGTYQADQAQNYNEWYTLITDMLTMDGAGFSSNGDCDMQASMNVNGYLAELGNGIGQIGADIGSVISTIGSDAGEILGDIGIVLGILAMFA